MKLRTQGHRVVLVSSGAIGVGLRRMDLKERGKGLHQKQVSKSVQSEKKGGVDADASHTTNRPLLLLVKGG